MILNLVLSAEFFLMLTSSALLDFNWATRFSPVFVRHWHWHLLSLLVTVYNVGHDSLVSCPLLNIITFCTFILNYTAISLIFATSQFMIYSSSYFITDLFHFSLYLLKYSQTFCGLSLSLTVATLLIPIICETPTVIVYYPGSLLAVSQLLVIVADEVRLQPASVFM
jgi:hypothetical protein